MDEYNKGGIIIGSAAAAAATVTATLTAPPAGMVNKLVWVCLYAAAATAADLQFQRNDATLLMRIGGAGIAILGQVLVFGSSSLQPGYGLPDDTAADAAKLVLTTTAGTKTMITYAYALVPA